MTQTCVVVVGGSRGTMEVGYGSYAIITGQRKKVTHVEFGGPMSIYEALYDTLLMALNTLGRQGNVSTMQVEIQCPVNTFVAMLGKSRSPKGLSARHKRVHDMLAQFQSYELVTINPIEAQHHIAG